MELHERPITILPLLRQFNRVHEIELLFFFIRANQFDWVVRVQSGISLQSSSFSPLLFFLHVIFATLIDNCARIQSVALIYITKPETDSRYLLNDKSRHEYAIDIRALNNSFVWYFSAYTILVAKFTHSICYQCSINHHNS